ncbi:Dopamine N-acetyltransferase [Folsomia candida]|uniref:Dopamine N-acetyltransferase n=1 Tax=Folsomia candida TaxID=158441 RepID=A0A226EH24_FOLCA|nr:Dopamine N-acetyltransferase [Folsomia candida]
MLTPSRTRQLIRLKPTFPRQYLTRRASCSISPVGGLPNNIKISKIGNTPDHLMVTDFLLHNFYRHEPIGINIEKEVSDWLPKYIEANFSRSIPISAKAIDESTGKVVGISVAVVIDPKQPKLPMMMDFLEPASQPIMHQIRVFLDEIDEGLNAAELLGIKSLTTDRDPRILDNLLVSVDKKYWNKSIGTELIRKNVEYAKKDKECLAAKVVVTSEYSYKAYLKVGYQMVREFQYAKYTNPDGVKIFVGKEPQLGINLQSRVMIKDLSSV